MGLSEHRRIAIVGSSAAGKTTLAHALAGALELPHVELDRLPRSELRAAAEEVAATDAWIIDGNYRSLRNIIWSRATALVWLNYSLGVVMRRAMSRSLSALWFSARTHYRRRRQYPRDLDRFPHLIVYRFDTPRDAANVIPSVARDLCGRVAPPALTGSSLRSE